MPVEEAEEANEEESFGEPGLKSATSSGSSSSSSPSSVCGGSGGSLDRCVRAKDFCKSLILARDRNMDARLEKEEAQKFVRGARTLGKDRRWTTSWGYLVQVILREAPNSSMPG